MLKKNRLLETQDADCKYFLTERSVLALAANHPFLTGLYSCFQTTVYNLLFIL